LETFCSYDSKLGGHPDRNKVNGVIASTGSLGHGLPIAVGLALAKKIKNEKGRIYCIIGDGESNEGTIWESAILATHLKLSNLTCIVDYNDSQIRAVSTNKILEKFKSFDWNVENIEDGHDINEIQRRIFMTHEKYPTCIIANTVKGFGIKEIEEDMFSWHHRPPTDVELHKFLQELKV
jgi:transketolase